MADDFRLRKAFSVGPLGLIVLAFIGLVGVLVTAASAQFFDDRFPFDSRPPRGLFGAPAYTPPRPVDYSRAPASRKYEKNEPPNLSTVLVLGDSMADWLGFGLEQAYSETPEMTVVRRARAYTGLLANHGKLETKGRNTDWVVNATDTLAKEQPNFIVVMLGLSDRDSIREPPKPVAKPEAKTEAKGDGAAKPESNKPNAAKADNAAKSESVAKAEGTAKQTVPAKPDSAATTANSANASADSDASKAQNDDAEAPPDDDQPATPQRAAGGSAEFKSERWVELYTKRVDEMIAALKSKGVPVFWVGLPSIRGTRSMADVLFLNDLYRSRAEKAGIVYVDVWDGFVDENNRYAQQGPDFEGQIRRLRTSDGVHFTQAGAVKLAHYVDREIHRAMTPTGPVAIALPVEPDQQQTPGNAPPGVAITRPLAGPVIPLNASNENDSDNTDELAGASGARQSLADAVATKVLVRGEPMPAPAGRADDFAWPQRAPAPQGADPVAATTSLPMTPMVAERPPGGAPAAATVAAQPRVKQASASGNARVPRPPGAIGQQAQSGPREYRRQSPPFFFFFGGR